MIKKDEKKSFKYSLDQGILPTTEQTVYFCMGSQLIVIYVQIKPLNINYHHKPFCHFTNYSSDITSIINIY